MFLILALSIIFFGQHTTHSFKKTFVIEKNHSKHYHLTYFLFCYLCVRVWEFFTYTFCPFRTLEKLQLLFFWHHRQPSFTHAHHKLSTGMQSPEKMIVLWMLSATKKCWSWQGLNPWVVLKYWKCAVWMTILLLSGQYCIEETKRFEFVLPLDFRLLWTF